QRPFLDGQLDRWQWRVLSELMRDHLVHGNTYSRLGALFGVSDSEEYGNRAVVVESPAAVLAVGGTRLGMAESGHHIDKIAKRFERLEDFRKLKARPLCRGRPMVHGGAMRNINTRQPALRTCLRFAQRRLRGDHRFQHLQ